MESPTATPIRAKAVWRWRRERNRPWNGYWKRGKVAARGWGPGAGCGAKPHLEFRRGRRRLVKARHGREARCRKSPKLTSWRLAAMRKLGVLAAVLALGSIAVACSGGSGPRNASPDGGG